MDPSNPFRALHPEDRETPPPRPRDPASVRGVKVKSGRRRWFGSPYPESLGAVDPGDLGGKKAARAASENS